MRIDHVTQPLTAEIAKKVDAVQKKSGSAKAKSIDSAAFSQDGKVLSETNSAVEATKAHVSNTPEVRFDRVEEVKQKIKDGFYNSPEFIDSLADKLITDLGKDLGIS